MTQDAHCTCDIGDMYAPEPHPPVYDEACPVHGTLATKLAELVKEAEGTLDFYAEKGRVIVAYDGNVVQRVCASAEIAIAKVEREANDLRAEVEELKRQKKQHRENWEEMRRREQALQAKLDLWKNVMIFEANFRLVDTTPEFARHRDELSPMNMVKQACWEAIAAIEATKKL